MLKKNLVISLVGIENKVEETLLEIKSSNDRSQIILEPRLQKVVLDVNELKDAIQQIELFSQHNPSQQSAPENKQTDMEFERNIDE